MDPTFAMYLLQAIFMDPTFAMCLLQAIFMDPTFAMCLLQAIFMDPTFALCLLVRFLICLASLILSVLSTIAEYEIVLGQILVYMEPLLLLWLMAEYSLRVWSAGCRSRYQGWNGRLRFAQRPLCIVDIVIILASLMVIIMGSTTQMFAASTMKGLRFFQILRMVRIDRKAGTWKLLASVVWAHRRELLTTVYIGFLGLLFSSFLVYLAEKDHDKEKFGTFPDALWWGVITLCTVGYGDVVPDTWLGKIIAAFSAIVGISFFALPAGILGSGFALKVQQQQRQKHLIRRRVPAATLIQCLWRCYAADENSMSVATWKPHMIPCPSPSTERPFKNNTSFVSRFSTRRRDRSGNTNNNMTTSMGGPHSPSFLRKESKRGNSHEENEIPETLQSLVNRTWSHLSLATGLVDQRVDKLVIMRESSIASFVNKDHSEEELDSPKVRELTDLHKRVIRALRKIRFFVARRKFREALRPYDVTDVIEQYSAGHIDMLSRVKSLQGRLDQILGKVGSKAKDVYESRISLASRIVKVERQVEDIETKLDLLIDLYKEDRKTILQKLNPSESNAENQKPRPILIDKKNISAPSSPKTTKIPMQRNLSDLSSRIRKRVTYRLPSAPPVCVSVKDEDLLNTQITGHAMARSLSENNAITSDISNQPLCKNGNLILNTSLTRTMSSNNSVFDSPRGDDNKEQFYRTEIIELESENDSKKNQGRLHPVDPTGLYVLGTQPLKDSKTLERDIQWERGFSKDGGNEGGDISNLRKSSCLKDFPTDFSSTKCIKEGSEMGYAQARISSENVNKPKFVGIDNGNIGSNDNPDNMIQHKDETILTQKKGENQNAHGPVTSELGISEQIVLSTGNPFSLESDTTEV